LGKHGLFCQQLEPGDDDLLNGLDPRRVFPIAVIWVSKTW
jgi:hypothetical protein